MNKTTEKLTIEVPAGTRERIEALATLLGCTEKEIIDEHWTFSKPLGDVLGALDGASIMPSGWPRTKLAWVIAKVAEDDWHRFCEIVKGIPFSHVALEPSEDEAKRLAAA